MTDDRTRQMVAQAVSALDVSDAVRRGLVALPDGDASVVAMDLLHIAARRLLDASTTIAAEVPDPMEASNGRPPIDQADLQRLSALTHAPDSDPPAVDADAEAAYLRTVAAALGEHAGARDGHQDERRRPFLRRGLAAALLFFVLASGFGLRAALEPRDLAKGRQWSASSKWDGCELEKHRCGSTPTDLFVHTTEEDNPWIEMDLGAVHDISEIFVKNRQDCCRERAVPLAVELSNDRKTWRLVARKVDAFSTWKEHISHARARYVRLRVERRSLIHLEKVEIRGS